MKSFILIAVLAALTVCSNATSIRNEVAPGQEDVIRVQESIEGYQKDYNFEGARSLFTDDELILFHEESFNLPAVPHTVQTRDVIYRGNSTTIINRISFSHLPAVPGHTHTRNERTFAHVRQTSAPGVGLRCTIKFYGRYSDWL